MEKIENEQRVGSGITILSIVYLVFQGFGLFALVSSIVMKEQIIAKLAESGAVLAFNSAEIIISIILSIIFIASLILILMKKSIGAYLFIAVQALSIIYNIITGAFTFASIFGLILPGLMIYLLYRKKEIYFERLKF
ncbi:hypothetical protein E5347_01435 [Clostridium sartagoforme]|uniref:DUF4064 domain-containing protein n=1 Tax=Clostridium sartagoforme TaxID=84031 RepID=A0A4S2DR26_9CLOT|nr:hypothetical protein [Clostridium sartagoforme]TGY43501.1 hypothetical protein E5347_01435 [Clostridium sartagoforme]